MSILQYIQTLCAGLYADEFVDNYIAISVSQTSAGFFGSNYSYAVALRACHIWTLSQRGGEGVGGVNQKSEGSLSMSFGEASAQQRLDDLGQTSFGLQLMALIKRTKPIMSIDVGSIPPEAGSL